VQILVVVAITQMSSVRSGQPVRTVDNLGAEVGQVSLSMDIRQGLVSPKHKGESPLDLG